MAITCLSKNYAEKAYGVLALRLSSPPHRRTTPDPCADPAPSIAEADAEADGGAATAAIAGGTSAGGGHSHSHSRSLSPSNQALASQAGDSWSAWHRWLSPGLSGTSLDSPAVRGAEFGPGAQPPHPHSPHPQPLPLPPSLTPSSFMLQPQLISGRGLSRGEGGVGVGVGAPQARSSGGGWDQHPSLNRDRCHAADADDELPTWRGEGKLTEPLLKHNRYSGGKLDDIESAEAAAPGLLGAAVRDGGGVAAIPAAAAAAAAASTGGPHGAVAAPPPPAHAVSDDVRHRSSFFNALVFGIINAVVSMPTLIAYAAIVFKSPLYTPYIDSLCRFFFFSSGIHQLVFVALSTLPFAIGQVQDVGLIFLSAMASDIALRVTGPDAAAVALGSSLLAMTISTAIVGLLTVVVARLKLADMVSYVPLPVVGGYLGFVGYFCIAGGTALAAGVQVDTLISWSHLLAWDPLVKLLPTAASIAALMTCVAHVSHPLALPGLITAIPLTFHGVLWAGGWDLQAAQRAGWVMAPSSGLSNCWQLWGLYNLQHGGLAHGVDLRAMLAQLPKLVGLFLVVCFGSCMDVAAIQSDMPTPLDFNRELMTVGVSNMVTGVLGAGYTGSYIFSQTVFTMRQGVFNRVNGLAVAIVELLVFALPFSVVQYMPNFFFGALLVWFGIEISRDWLILSYRKLSRPEYVLLWATFLSIMNGGLELGIGAGIVMATLYFAYQYAQSQVSSLRQVAARSGRTHMYDTSSTLDLLGRRMAVLRLSGYVFFGSSTGLSNQVLQLAARMLQERAEEQRQHEEWAITAEQRDGKESDLNGRTELLGGSAATATPPVPVSASAPAAVTVAAGPPPPGVAGSASADGGCAAPHDAAGAGEGGAPVSQLASAPLSGLGCSAGSGCENGDTSVPLSERHWRAAAAISHAPIVLILDFGSVSGMDSTAARTFATLVTTLASQHVNVIFTNLGRSDFRKLLQANGLPLRPYTLPPPPSPSPDSARGTQSPATAGHGGSGGEAAAGTREAGKQQPHQQPHQAMPTESVLLRPSAGGCWELSSPDAAVRCCEDAYLALAIAVGLLPATSPQAASLQQLLTRNLREVFPSVPSDLGGLVGELEGALTRRQLQLGDVLYGAGAAVRGVYVIEFGALVEEEHYEGGVRVGSREHGAGVVVGALQFFLGRPASATVRCSSAACQLLCISRGTFARLMAHHPRALAALQVLLMRSACLDLASAQEAANHIAAV
ncbi:hypothetical protein VOLCADRAFT_94701 [Volvox carteri f. nagariensis]|uniref:STAS domain-containing protein n=1 Tax=Volvox carteri f. nagariensis TaxID=3068 RepID=D8U5I2_VOLCA|nr:uncharacterized protein VOLCADRAFT_94701 [Volvox carteri f. nagariensis]EFJ45005.1 hypothetical protein VOLCADRAFT_94701 [Volvox carteri f. nagariensis]|eukprot:XP_002953976.1 hypothetical protein VOLCADRAFT_94701 [Volvox carteri f. nagariensis]